MDTTTQYFKLSIVDYRINSVEYHGRLKDGMFHGRGIVWYPNNSRVEGIWKKGCNVKRKYFYNDGLTYQDQGWQYCKYPDRRFKKEITYGIQPTGRTMLSNRVPPRPIPPGCYDTGDGFYNPDTKCIVHPITNAILRIPPLSEAKWILQHCRKSDGLCLLKIEDKKDPCTYWTLGIEVPQLQDQIHISSSDELEMDEQEEDKSLKVGHKAAGRYNLLYKKVSGKPYTSKFIFADERTSRPCRKHRLYLPALRIKTKINVIPNFRVVAPKNCEHELKAIVANKLILLLSLLKESEEAGGINLINPLKLGFLKNEFANLLDEEGKTKLQGTVAGSSIDLSDHLKEQLISARAAASTSAPKRKSKRSKIKESPEVAHVKKELRDMLDKISLQATNIVNDIHNNGKDYQPGSYIREHEECEVCTMTRNAASDKLKKQKLIQTLVRQGDTIKVDSMEHLEETRSEMTTNTACYHCIEEELDEIYDGVLEDGGFKEEELASEEESKKDNGVVNSESEFSEGELDEQVSFNELYEGEDEMTENEMIHS